MPHVFRCEQGHDWSVIDPTGSSLCPVCGSAGASSLNADLDRTVTPADDLPPLPRARGPWGAGSAAPPASVPGYEIIEELGRGGMGVVYKARQSRLNRTVALKLMRSGDGATPEEVARFRAEAEAVAHLQHPHIVQIFDVIEYDDRLLCALEYVPGGSLAQKLGGKPLAPRDAAALVATLARAMEHAHDRGIVHRDLKPANILLSAECGARGAELQTLAAGPGPSRSAPRAPHSALLPKITDFGLVKRLDRGDGPTKSGAILGTPCYMAPEQAQGRPSEVGPWTDVYALGAILYECLTGRPPFRGETAMETLIQVVSEAPAPPSRVRADVPQELDAVCLRCLEKSPAQRYPTAHALADDLQRFLDRPTGRAASRPRPGVWRYLAAAGVVAGIVAVAVLLVSNWRPGGPVADSSTPGGTTGEPAGAPGQPPGPPEVPAALTWDVSQIAGGEKFDRLAFPTRSVGYAASRTMLYKTDDGGRTWRPHLGEAPGRVYLLHFESELVGWLGTDLLRHTRDGGKTWETVSWPGTPTLKAVTGLAAGSGGWALAGGTTDQGELVLVRRRGPGTPWDTIDPATMFRGEEAKYRSWFLASLVTVGERSALAVLFEGRSGGGVVLRTDNAGDTWSTVLTTPDDLSHVAVAANGHGWLAGTGGALWHTTDGGKTWQPHDRPDGIDVGPGGLAVAPDGRLGLMTLWQGRVAVTRGGATWSFSRIGDDFGYSMPGVAVVDADTAFVLAADGRLAAFRR